MNVFANLTVQLIDIRTLQPVYDYPVNCMDNASGGIATNNTSGSGTGLANFIIVSGHTYTVGTAASARYAAASVQVDGNLGNQSIVIQMVPIT